MLISTLEITAVLEPLIPYLTNHLDTHPNEHVGKIIANFLETGKICNAIHHPEQRVRIEAVVAFLEYFAFDNNQSDFFLRVM